jgi:hypothetical protein
MTMPRDHEPIAMAAARVDRMLPFVPEAIEAALCEWLDLRVRGFESSAVERRRRHVVSWGSGWSGEPL